MSKFIIKLLLLVLVFAAAGINNAKAEQSSFEQILAAAEQGNADAENALGLIYFSGQKGANKSDEGFRWFEKAANQGHPAAMYNLGILYCNGKGVAADKAKGTEWVQKAANAGNSDALYMIGTMYQSGELAGSPDFNQAYTFVNTAASNGFPEAQNRLGYFYTNGMGVVKNEKTAHEWYLKAANAGLPKAQHNVGEDYFFGTGVKKNETTAIYWYQKSAKAGFADSQLKLAAISHRQGDTKEATRLVKKAAIGGNSKAKDMLSVISQQKDDPGEPRDPSEALKLYSKKANEGDRDAQYKLGMIYLKMGDEAQGVKWIEAAASLGQPAALRLTQINSNYHQSNSYIDRLNEENRQKSKQQYRNMQNVRQDVLNRLR